MDRFLIDYIPPILQEVKEYKAVTDSEQEEINILWNAVEERFHDQFVKDATITGIKRWEKLLQISPKGSNTQEERRFRILLRLNEQLPFTYRILEQKLAALFGEDGFELDLNCDAYSIGVTIHTFSFVAYEEVVEYLRRMLPANLGYTPQISFRTTGPLHVGSLFLEGETVTVFPRLPEEITSVGCVNTASCYGAGVESVIIYPKEVAF